MNRERIGKVIDRRSDGDVRVLAVLAGIGQQPGASEETPGPPRKESVRACPSNQMLPCSGARQPSGTVRVKRMELARALSAAGSVQPD